MSVGLTVDEKEDLLHDLRSSDDKRRQYAARALAKNISSGETARFMRTLQPHEWEAKIAVCKIFGKIGDDAAIEKLKGLILDFNPKVRQEAARELKKLGIDKPFSDDEVAELVSFLNHPSWWVKIKAIKSLEAIKDPRAAEPISRLMLDEDEDVRNAAIEAVSSLNKPKS